MSTDAAATEMICPDGPDQPSQVLPQLHHHGATAHDFAPIPTRP